MMHRTLLAAALCSAVLLAQPATLDIYVLDVEGGNATLFVTPSREAVLIDTGNGGPAAGRDADRIMAAVTDAGVVAIDVLVTSHWVKECTSQPCWRGSSFHAHPLRRK
jgi:beta-lactamase superfamily II metal-dependent hydrolase